MVPNVFQQNNFFTCILVENGISSPWHNSSLFCRAPVTGITSISEHMNDDSPLHGMDSILLVLCEYLERGKNNSLSIPQAINFDLVFLWVQYSVFKWTICSWKASSEDIVKWKTPTILLFSLIYFFLYKSFSLLLPHLTCSTVPVSISQSWASTLLSSVTFSAKLDPVTLFVIEKDLPSWLSHVQSSVRSTECIIILKSLLLIQFFSMLSVIPLKPLHFFHVHYLTL